MGILEAAWAVLGLGWWRTNGVSEARHRRPGPSPPVGEGEDRPEPRDSVLFEPRLENPFQGHAHQDEGEGYQQEEGNRLQQYVELPKMNAPGEP